MSLDVSEQSFDEMFQAGGGSFAPSFSFVELGSAVYGKIAELEQQNQTDINDSTRMIYDARGNIKQQLKVVLETNLRGWQGVSRVPTDGDMQNPKQLDPSEDDGRRAIYVKGWMLGSVRDAVTAATGQAGAPRVGGMLGVRHHDHKPAQPRDIKLYEAQYKPPAAEDAMFAPAPQQQQQAPPQQQQAPPQQQQQVPQQQQAQFAQAAQQQQQQQQQQAPPQPQQWEQPAEAQQWPQQAPAQPDPWSAPAAPAQAGDPWATTDEPPF